MVTVLAGGAPAAALRAFRCGAARRSTAAPAPSPHAPLRPPAPRLASAARLPPRRCRTRAARRAGAAASARAPGPERTQRWSLGAGSALKLSIASAADAPGVFAITVWTDRPGRLLLHWGLLQPAAVTWACPPAAVLAELCPRGSVSYQGWAGGRALQTPLSPEVRGGSGASATLRLSAADAPHGVAFLLWDADSGAVLSCPDSGDAFMVALDELVWEGAPPTRARGAPADAAAQPPAAAAAVPVLTAAQRAARAGNPFGQLSLRDAHAVLRSVTRAEGAPADGAPASTAAAAASAAAAAAAAEAAWRRVQDLRRPRAAAVPRTAGQPPAHNESDP